MNKSSLHVSLLGKMINPVFGSIYAVTETDGNTVKPVKLLDRIFTLPPVQGTKLLVSGTQLASLQAKETK